MPNPEPKPEFRPQAPCLLYGVEHTGIVAKVGEATVKANGVPNESTKFPAYKVYLDTMSM